MNHAVYYSDEVIGLKNGKVLLQGEPEDVITPDSMRKCMEFVWVWSG